MVHWEHQLEKSSIKQKSQVCSQDPLTHVSYATRGRLPPLYIKHASLLTPPELVIEILAALTTYLLVQFPSQHLLNSGPSLSTSPFLTKLAISSYRRRKTQDSSNSQCYFYSLVLGRASLGSTHQCLDTREHRGALLTVPLWFPVFLDLAC